MSTNIIPSRTVLLRHKKVWRDYCADLSNQSGETLSVGIASSFTGEPLEPYLGAALLEANIHPTFSFAPYNQIFQVCLDAKSTFGGTLPKCIVIVWRIEELLGATLDQWCQGDETALHRATEQLGELASSIRGLSAQHDGPIIVSTPPFPMKPESDIKNLHNPHGLGFFHTHVMSVWLDMLQQLEGVIVLDIDGLQRDLGIAASHDARNQYLYKQPFTEAFLYSISTQISRLLKAVYRPIKKCVAVDCDNTLWGGIIGEDGLSGIQLGHDFPGSAFRDFQQLILSWKEQGVLITLLSKNNEEDVWQVFDHHEDMILQRSDIAAWRINWVPKPNNLKELADELNLGYDSFSFIDDNSFEIEHMRETFPSEVECFQIPEEPADILTELKSLCWFDKLSVSQEDRTRTAMMISERDRKPLQDALSPEEFMASLQLKLDLFSLEDKHITRVAQLINKTNQFNLTTIRRSEEEVRQLLASDTHKIFVAHISDRFGEYGITGVVIIEMQDTQWYLDTFLLSCRVLGRGVETGIIDTIANHARNSGAMQLTAHYIPTQKNTPIASFLPDHDFEGDEGVLTLELNKERLPSNIISIEFRP